MSGIHRIVSSSSILLGLSVLTVISATGCRPLSRERTLPPSIRNVHVPMAFNRTAEPGLEERVTVEVQKEILADGRLNLTPARDADAIILITLNDFNIVADTVDRDEFPIFQQYRARTTVDIRENIPGLPPIGKPRRVETDYGFNADPRTTTFDPEPRVKENFTAIHAKDIVLQMLTGDIIDPALPEQNDRPQRARSPLGFGL